ncbi:MAG TPA: hopanoid biosynthesis associated radical SAM protein HpnJ [Verrucomicrobiae bacterium]|nr:hopanoid biosynthesis associated radical SAM protein HpnJ [Verrucomicrobiae bacterium]
MGGTLFVNPPSFEGFDGGAGSRYQARREVTSFWYPTWLAQPAALVPGSRLLDCPPHGISREECLRIARDFDHVILHTSTPSLQNDCRVAEAMKAQRPGTVIGFVGPHPAVLPEATLNSSRAIDWVGREEFDYTCKDVADGRPFEDIKGLSYRDREGQVRHNPDRELLADMDDLPSVADVYRRDLDIGRYYIGYLLHPYISFYTGRGCPARCSFCLWPQTIGGHQYRVRSSGTVVNEVRRMKDIFPEVKEFFFDDDTFTANLPRAREIASGLAELGVTWSCNSRANLTHDNIRFLKDRGLRLLLVGYESGNGEILRNIKKGLTLGEMRAFTRDCRKAGVTIHGTFIIGLPGETPDTIEESIRFAMDLDVFSIQVSLAAPYPGTELFEQAQANGWLRPLETASVRGDGYQDAVLQYPGLSRDDMLEAVDRFYRRYFLRPRPILRILKTMLADKDICVRRIREGFEFFRSLRALRTT